MKRNKFLAMAAVAAIISGALTLSASADGGVNVIVTMSDGNGLVAANEMVEVTDLDSDGTITIFDALTAAHDKLFEGGAKEGFTVSETDFGLSINKLWGVENGGSYGYYLNNEMPSSLLAEVNGGDALNAYCFADLAAWSDMYAYFDTLAVSVEAEQSFEVNLFAKAFDADWNPVTVPVTGAALTVDGTLTDAVTDENGKATLTLDKAGSYIVSAVSDAQTLVPAALSVNVKEKAETAPTDKATGDTPVNPETGVTFSLTAVIAAAAVTAYARKRNAR